MTIKSVLIALPLMFAGWLSVLMATALMTDSAPAYVVVLPSDRFLTSIPETASILAENAVSVTLTSSQSGFAKQLYRQGAWLVLPAGLRGCLPLPRTAG